ncbi:hypothetical protein L3X38_043861 [Prunus dulcis]|uniref:Leucine-rich repeat family protein n=1 Tax=Prunus dulcis TaxID=3755 RepID=A0AAD4UXA5_PRUDU|nr:hypothetical protein L3X38_043861 [Prunus dulcis]
MATFSFFASLLISIFLVHLCLYHEVEKCPPPPPPSMPSTTVTITTHLQPPITATITTTTATNVATTATNVATAHRQNQNPRHRHRQNQNRLHRHRQNQNPPPPPTSKTKYRHRQNQNRRHPPPPKNQNPRHRHNPKSKIAAHHQHHLPQYPFESQRIELAYHVFQNFSRLIKSDPNNFAKSWQGPNVCKYKGVVLRYSSSLPSQKAVAGLDINGALFAGDNAKLPLDGFLDKLEDLAFFHANSNNFTGSVPKDGFQTIILLARLDLSRNNKLIGGFPNEDYFAGSVRPEVFKLDVMCSSSTTTISIRRFLTILVPPPAHYFTFANNKFTGPIPRSIGQASKTLFGGFSSLGTNLQGACRMKWVLKPGHGVRLPEQVCTLSNLGNLSLANNYFTEVGPECRKLMKKKLLDVRQNCILGEPNQKTKAQCNAFFSKPRKCPNEKEMTYVPCKRYLRSNEKKPEHQKQASAPLSYGSLVRHRL